MPTLGLIAVSGSGFPADYHLELLKFSGSGTVNASFNADFLRISGSGTPRMVLEAFPDTGDKEPFSSFTLTARSSGATPTSYTWRKISGPALDLPGTGSSITFTLPGTIDGVVMTIGVIGHLGAQNSDEQVAAISILPSTIVSRVVNGVTTWAPAGIQRRD